MEVYRVTERTCKEWIFGPALRQTLKKVDERNPAAQLISATIRVDDTLFEWVYKDEELKKV